jgi:hypothetical protein
LREAVSEFAGRLEELTFEEKQHVIRILVDKVIVEGRNVVINLFSPEAQLRGVFF